MLKCVSIIEFHNNASQLIDLSFFPFDKATKCYEQRYRACRKHPLMSPIQEVNESTLDENPTLKKQPHKSAKDDTKYISLRSRTLLVADHSPKKLQVDDSSSEPHDILDKLSTPQTHGRHRSCRSKFMLAQDLFPINRRDPVTEISKDEGTRMDSTPVIKSESPIPTMTLRKTPPQNYCYFFQAYNISHLKNEKAATIIKLDTSPALSPCGVDKSITTEQKPMTGHYYESSEKDRKRTHISLCALPSLFQYTNHY